MINHEFFKAIEGACQEKGVTKEQLLDAIEKGISNAYKRETGVANVKLVFNEEKGEIVIVEYYTIVGSEEELDPQDPSIVTIAKARTVEGMRKSVKVGDYVEIKRNVNPKDFGRIAINSAKQIFNQEIKRNEREKAFEYFKAKEDEMIIGTVSSAKDNYVYFDLGYDISASVSKTELLKDECKVGTKIRLYVTKVEMTTKGPRVYVSRSDKNLIKRLFEDNIPEIKDGVIEILGIARDPGDRTKVCVKSLNPDVDALGACLGAKGQRAIDIVKYLGGEKVDIYEYSDDPKEFVANALKPADVLSVQINAIEKQALAIVPDDHFSLAIGKKGQNVRLAVQSSGWKIDIKSVSQGLEEGIEF